MIARDMLVMLLSLSVAMLALAPLWPGGSGVRRSLRVILSVLLVWRPSCSVSAPGVSMRHTALAASWPLSRCGHAGGEGGVGGLGCLAWPTLASAFSGSGCDVGFEVGIIL